MKAKLGADVELETLEHHLDRQLGWVRAAETRLALILPLGTALFGVIAIRIGTIADDESTLLLAAWSSLFIIVASLACAIVSNFPRTVDPETSNVFFGSIAASDRKDFVKRCKEVGDEELKADLLEQIHINATIAASKYKWTRFSIILLTVSFPLWAYSAAQLY